MEVSVGTKCREFPDRTYSNSCGGTSRIDASGEGTGVGGITTWFILLESTRPTQMPLLSTYYSTHTKKRWARSCAFCTIRLYSGRLSYTEDSITGCFDGWNNACTETETSLFRQSHEPSRSN